MKKKVKNQRVEERSQLHRMKEENVRIVRICNPFSSYMTTRKLKLGVALAFDNMALNEMRSLCASKSAQCSSI